jgi:hypothetical protein
MTKNNQQKNDGFLNFLTSVLKKEDGQEKPKETSILTASVAIIASELKQLASSVDMLVTAVANQNKAISDLYTVQEFLLKNLKNDIELESKLPDINKTKREKPN